MQHSHEMYPDIPLLVQEPPSGKSEHVSECDRRFRSVLYKEPSPNTNSERTSTSLSGLKAVRDKLCSAEPQHMATVYLLP